MNNSTPVQDLDFNGQYDKMILSSDMRRLYNGSDFYNVGYWTESTSSIDEACRQLVYQHLKLITGMTVSAKIIDVGCGLGATTSMIAERYGQATVTGINLSQNQIDYARNRYPNLKFEVMDAAQLNYPDAQIDVIISVEAAFHFNTRLDFIKRAFKILRPGGQLIFSDILLKDTHWVGEWSVPKQNHISQVAEYIGLLNQSPFTVDRIDDLTENSWLGFCSFLDQIDGLDDLAEGLRKSIIAYLLVKMSKPL